MSKPIENSNSSQVTQQYLRCNYTKFQLKILNDFYMCLVFRGYQYFCKFYYRNDRENGIFAEKCEALLFLVANVILYMRGTTIIILSIR